MSFRFPTRYLPIAPGLQIALLFAGLLAVATAGYVLAPQYFEFVVVGIALWVKAFFLYLLYRLVRALERIADGVEGIETSWLH